MAGSLYLGSSKVCPVIVVGSQEPFPVKTTRCYLDTNLNLVVGCDFDSWYKDYNEKPFYVDASNVEAMDEGAYNYNVLPVFVSSFENSSVKYIDFSNLSYLPVISSVSTRGAPFRKIIAGTDGVHIYFRALNSQTNLQTSIFSNLCQNATNAVVHFPSNMQTIIEQASLSGYPNFGGTNTTLAFDLTATT